MRLPDKPGRELLRKHLDALEGMGYLCSLKLDGWRCIATYDGVATTYSSCSGMPLLVKPDVRKPFEAALCRLLGRLPAQVDCELTGRRREGDADGIFVLELLRLGDQDFTGVGRDGGYTAQQRYTAAAELFGINAWPGKTHPGEVALKGNYAWTVPMVRERFRDFYDWHQEHTPLAEGVVLKLDSSPVFCTEGRNYANPQWIKCKWRAGESGTSARE